MSSLADLLRGEQAVIIHRPSLPVSDDIFSGTRGPRDAEVMIVGEAWGDSERTHGKPFVGASGKELDTMLAEAGVDPSRCFYTNLVNEKPNANDMSTLLYDNKHKGDDLLNDGIKPMPRLIEGLCRLDAQIEAVKPKIIIATGNWPLWWLTHRAEAKTSKGYKLPTGIDKWRGSMLSLRPSPFRTLADIPVLPVYHPAAILRMYTWRKITVQDLMRVGHFLSGSPWSDPMEASRWFLIRPSFAELKPILEGWMKAKDNPVVCDLETKAYRPHIIGLTRDGKTCIAIPFFEITPDGFRPLYSPLEYRNIYELLVQFFNSGVKFVGQNFLYDIQYIIKFFFCAPEVHWDTIIGQHVAWPSLRKSLDFQASMYCRQYVYWKDDLKESTENMDWRQACMYNCEDLWRTHEIWQVQVDVLQSIGKMEQFRERMEVFPCVVDMMEEGVLIDRAMKDKQRIELLFTASSIAAWLEDCVPDAFKTQSNDDTPWFGSPQKLAWFLYDVIKLKPVVNRKTGARTTNKEALVELGDRYPQWSGLLSAILLLRSVRVVAGNILSAPLESDGRMRTSYNLSGPETYRLASSENVWGGGGNMQNIMRDREDMDLLEQDLI